MPSATSSSARPRISRIFGGCDSVSIVSATAGFARNECGFGEFFDVHITTCSPFHVNANLPRFFQRGGNGSGTAGRPSMLAMLYGFLFVYSRNSSSVLRPK